MFEFLNKILGNKSGRDMKTLNPRVPAILAEYDQLHQISNDELRARSAGFRKKIAAELNHLDSESEKIQAQLDAEPDMDPVEKDGLFKQLDDLKKKRNENLEKVLDEILPEAFAVMKETAKRFTENKDIRSTATQRDRDLAVDQDFVDIEGNEAVYHN